jgi:uncharacterized protein YndB with AHSA1/START domain
MSERTAEHDTTVVERKFKSSPARVFAAWEDPDAYGRWNYPGEDRFDLVHVGVWIG